MTMTIRQKFFIHYLMNKVKGYIEACHIYLKMKLKYMKNRPVYGRIPVDYARSINRYQNYATSFLRIPSIVSYNM